MPWKPQRPEAFLHLLLRVPGIDAGEIDVLPAEWRDVLEQFIWNDPPMLPQTGCGATEIDGVPVDDGADDQIKAGCTECLAIERSVTDFTALMEEDGALELVSGFTLVEAGLTTSTQPRAGIPLDHKQRALDAAKFTQGFCEITGFRGSGEPFQDC